MPLKSGRSGFQAALPHICSVMGSTLWPLRTSVYPISKKLAAIKFHLPESNIKSHTRCFRNGPLSLKRDTRAQMLQNLAGTQEQKHQSLAGRLPMKTGTLVSVWSCCWEQEKYQVTKTSENIWGVFKSQSIHTYEGACWDKVISKKKKSIPLKHIFTKSGVSNGTCSSDTASIKKMWG